MVRQETANDVAYIMQSWYCPRIFFSLFKKQMLSKETENDESHALHYFKNLDDYCY